MLVGGIRAAILLLALFCLQGSQGIYVDQDATNYHVTTLKTVSHTFYSSTDDKSAITGFAVYKAGGCSLASFNGVSRYINYQCDTESTDVIIHTYDPAASAACSGAIIDTLRLTDNSLLTAIYGISTNVRATCKLPLKFDLNEQKNFLLRGYLQPGTCSGGTGTTVPGLAPLGYVFTTATFTATNLSLLVTQTNTFVYPCTTNATLYPVCNTACTAIGTYTYFVPSTKYGINTSFEDWLVRNDMSYSGEPDLLSAFSNPHSGTMSYVIIMSVFFILLTPFSLYDSYIEDTHKPWVQKKQ